MIRDWLMDVSAGGRVAGNFDEFGEHSRRSLVQFGFPLGFPRHSDPVPAELRFAEVRDWMRFASGAEHLNACFLDTTTLHTAETLLLGDSTKGALTPATLVDLNTFVNACILYDHVFHLENRYLDSTRLNEVLGSDPVVLEIPVQSFPATPAGSDGDTIGMLFRLLWNFTTNYIDNLHDANRLEHKSDPYYLDAMAIREAWERALAFHGRSELWFDPTGESVEEYDSIGPALLEELVSFQHVAQDDAVYLHMQQANADFVAFAHSVINDSNNRSLFNLHVSSMLELPYLPNSFRLPFRAFLYRRALEVQAALPLMKRIDREFRAVAELYYAPEDGNLELPFFLSGILAQAASPGEIPEILAEVRKRAAGFRETRSELEKALRDGSIDVAKKLRTALSGEARSAGGSKLAPLGKAIFGVLAQLGGFSTPLMLTLADAAVNAVQISRDERRRLLDRAFRRQTWFLADMRALAGELTLAYPRIRELWSLDSSLRMDSPELFAERFGRLQQIAY